MTRQLFENGTEQVGWRCHVCLGWTRPKGSFGIWIPRETLEANNVDIEALAVVAAQPKARCVVCGSRGAELHHWAPSGLFGADAERWPKDYLCRPCHMLWHDTVTPGLRRGGAS